MEFTYAHTIAAPLDKVLTALSDESFYSFSEPTTATIAPPELLEISAQPDAVVTKVRYAFTGSLSGPAASLIDVRKLTWVIETTLVPQTASATVEVIPDNYESMITCQGEMKFQATDGITIQGTQGNLRLHIPLVAKAGERAILSGLDTHLAGEASRLGAYCAST